MQYVASPTADPGVASLIPIWSHTFVEIDHEIISRAILLLPLILEGLKHVIKYFEKVYERSGKTYFGL